MNQKRTLRRDTLHTQTKHRQDFLPWTTTATKIKRKSLAKLDIHQPLLDISVQLRIRRQVLTVG